MATPTSLPATFVAGNVLTAAEMNDLRGAFRILQVVQATYSTAESTTSSSYVDTSLAATITPSSATSKVLVLCNGGSYAERTGTSTGVGEHAIERGGSQIYEFATTAYVDTATSAIKAIYTSFTLSYLDSPATTSATTYTLQHKISASGTLTTFYNNDTGSLILMEVSA